MKTTNLLIASLLFVALLLAGCSTKNAPVLEVPESAQAGDLTGLKECEFQPEGSKTKYAAECGTLVVPENWDKADSRLIALPVVRIPATGPNPAEPVFYLLGGPGLSNISSTPPDWMLEDHDVVVVGYRGVDGTVTLSCPEVSRLMQAHSGKDLFSEQARTEYVAAVKQCAVAHQEAGVDLSGYTVPGVVEDTIDLILNLKSIPIKLNSSHPETIHLRAEGAMEVKSGNIEANPNVEILNPDIHIATLSDEGRLDIEMRVKQGRGYISADRNFDTDLTIGFIPIDSLHSPVRKVSYVVEDARLGQTTDYDKLSIEVWTNGAVAPQSAVALASKLLKDHLSIFINFEETPEMDEEEIDREKDRLRENLMRSIEELELSVRSYNCLKNADIKSIADLVVRTEAEMLKTKNFGRKSLNEIKELLAEMGLSLGMKVDHILKPKEE